MIGNKSREDQIQAVITWEPKNSELLNDKRENDLVNIETDGPGTDGLSIIIPKRRRLEEPNEDGLVEVQNTGDTEMSENDKLSISDPKNLIMGGTATQSRPSL